MRPTKAGATAAVHLAVGGGLRAQYVCHGWLAISVRVSGVLLLHTGAQVWACLPACGDESHARVWVWVLWCCCCSSSML